ncbi:hypothetical protein [Salinarimonas soli]|uniref:DUF2029 domain-containing protein n=1 Tax=Salinarimonas soli TaxID=1638099 RepID=A0A5B2V8L2_9HYPH|nr:hypothetical protein [Salinarimonas soli]KAA2234800.1 hypothetical protein F0L46_22900 [Salinarimonas soli]
MQQRAGAILAFLIFAIVLTVGLVQPEGLLWSWDLLGVPRMPPPNPRFTDTISVTHSIDCLRAGFDPYRTGQCDPWGRMFNYPPVWLELRHLGVSSAATDVIGVSMALLAAGALLMILRATTPVGGALVILAILSPAVMFGIERGNVDVFLFSCLAFGLAITHRMGPASRWLARGGLVAVLAVLKAYPIAACIILVRQAGWRWAPAIAAGLISLLLFVVVSRNHLAFIFSNTPLTSYYSFGAAPLFLDLADWVGVPEESRTAMRWLGVGAAFVLGLAAAGLGMRLSQGAPTLLLPALRRGTFRDDLCLACLAIFCFSFLLGSNFNYRLIFLLGALPRMIEALEGRRQWRLVVLPSLVIALLWAVRLPAWAAHSANWIVYLISCAWLGTILPQMEAARVKRPEPHGV